MANVSVEASPIEGQGVFAAAEFRRGERILPIDDSRVVTEDVLLAHFHRGAV